MDGTDLREIYDEVTVARLERAAARRRGGSAAGRPASVAAWRRHTVAGAVVAGLVVGAQEALEQVKTEAIVEEVDLSGLMDRDRPVIFHYVVGDPAASRLVVRPWLLARSG